MRETVRSELRGQYDKGKVGCLRGERALCLVCALGLADWGSGPELITVHRSASLCIFVSST